MPALRQSLLANAIAACFIMMAISTTEAHGGCSSRNGCLVPRDRYHHDRYYWPQRSRRAPSPFDLMTEVFSTPVYTNSLMRQAEAQLERMQRSSPRYDIQEVDNVYELTMEVPGVPAENLSVELDQDVLRVSGTRQHASQGRFVETKFDQTFTLDNVDTENLKVTLSNGLLTIAAPKKERKVTRLAVEQAEPKEEAPILQAAEVNDDAQVAEEVDGLSISREEDV